MAEGGGLIRDMWPERFSEYPFCFHQVTADDWCISGSCQTLREEKENGGPDWVPEQCTNTLSTHCMALLRAVQSICPTNADEKLLIHNAGFCCNSYKSITTRKDIKAAWKLLERKQEQRGEVASTGWSISVLCFASLTSSYVIACLAVPPGRSGL